MIHNRSGTTAPGVVMNMHWDQKKASLSLHGTYEPGTDLRLAEAASILLNQHPSQVTIDVTEMHPYAPPACLRALMQMRARLRRGGIHAVIIQRRYQQVGLQADP